MQKTKTGFEVFKIGTWFYFCQCQNFLLTISVDAMVVLSWVVGCVFGTSVVSVLGHTTLPTYKWEIKLRPFFNKYFDTKSYPRERNITTII